MNIVFGFCVLFCIWEHILMILFNIFRKTKSKGFPEVWTILVRIILGIFLGSGILNGPLTSLKHASQLFVDILILGLAYTYIYIYSYTVLFLKSCPAKRNSLMGLVSFSQKYERSNFHNAQSQCIVIASKIQNSAAAEAEIQILNFGIK